MVFFVAYLYGGVKAVEGSGRWLYPLGTCRSDGLCVGVVLAWWVTRREDPE